MKRSVMTVLTVALLGFAAIAQADDKASPAGTWKFSVKGRNDQTREVTMKLKVDGEKLTGTVTGGRNNDMDIEISDGKFKDNEVTFNVVRERNGNKRTTKYTGKLEKDVIKGKIEWERRNGDKSSNEWEAKREETKS